MTELEWEIQVGSWLEYGPLDVICVTALRDIFFSGLTAIIVKLVEGSILS